MIYYLNYANKENSSLISLKSLIKRKAIKLWYSKIKKIIIILKNKKIKNEQYPGRNDEKTIKKADDDLKWILLGNYCNYWNAFQISFLL